MDIDAVSFPHHLLDVLVNISEADFVSFDLELSGIPSRIPGLTRPTGSNPSLEDRYLETKIGAERHQILQVGFTCGRFDFLANKYVLRPYNVTLSPLVDNQHLNVEREFSFQSGAVTFLKSHGFDLAAPFDTGVQYLSRQEATEAKKRAWDRLDNKKQVEDIQLKETEVQSLDFVRRVRECINKWNCRVSPQLEIYSNTGLKGKPLDSISNFEKRLVHQLVRAEFKKYITIGQRNCVKIVVFDAMREAENNTRLKNRIRDDIIHQTGFRWIFEALANGDISRADIRWYARDAAGGAIAVDHRDFTSRWDRAMDRLRRKQPVLVGHNMFTDLVYLYRCFVGDLPDTLHKFTEAIHALFPRIIDTKYLATHNEGDLKASPTLEKISKDLQSQPLPDIVTHTAHTKYHNSTAYHEAGYDSLLTATIMLRLAATLGDDWKSQPMDIDHDSASSEKSFMTALHEQPGALSVEDGVEKVTEPVPLPPAVHVPTTAESNFNKRKGKKNKTAPEIRSSSRFHTRNVFDSLRALSLNDEEDEASDDTDAAHEVFDQYGNSIKESKKPWQMEPYDGFKPVEYPINAIERKPMELIPEFDSDFWLEFGNKLRIYGTQETKLEIAHWPKPAA
ncbi:CAF1-domain-containing protein [Corynespora cassiicola Philippines]|uniref:CAF1-domain-containing protein n=1 Tax=Corynespora cassiicola Philippines TaxID=1448308 RepID=A0A2T2P8P2_CORCC|nr:CAF1-domain-containing protein [Corynespora cassiicola Philippines]